MTLLQSVLTFVLCNLAGRGGRPLGSPQNLCRLSRHLRSFEAALSLCRGNHSQAFGGTFVSMQGTIFGDQAHAGTRLTAEHA